MLKLFLNSFTIIVFLCGLTFLIAGFVMTKYPPKKINQLYGYRTKAAMKSQQSWDFAQKRSSHDLKLFGFGMMIFSIGGMFLPFGKWGWVFALITIFVFIGIMYFNTENALKNQFGI